MGRLHGEGLMPMIIRRHFQPMVDRFLAAFRRASPDLPDDEVIWRIHFMVGTMAHALCGPPDSRPGFGGRQVASDPQGVVQRLVAFLGAGFRAPVPPAAGSEERK
jgi:hypothetical protein